jgi:hypothetical protein
VLGLFGDNDLEPHQCTQLDDLFGLVGAEAAPRLRQFLGLWSDEHRRFCSVCLNDYSECFRDAVEIIDMTCDDYVLL